jgi:HPt (histidine-containing phosphotransfer) domain-containing protein
MQMVNRAAPDARAPIDLAFLSRQTMGDEALARELVGLFAEQAPALMAAIEGESPARIRQDAAHTLKGAAAAIGASEVARLAAIAEASIGAAAGHLGQDIARLNAAIEASREAIACWLGSAGGGSENVP